MKTQLQPKSDGMIIAEALKKAIDHMGINTSTIAQMMKINPTTLTRDFKNGFDMSSLRTDVAIGIIRMYRSLFAITGNNNEYMRHFLESDNKYFHQKPIDAIKTLDGLSNVNRYLDAMRGKV